MDTAEAKRLLDEVERRVQACELALGLTSALSDEMDEIALKPIIPSETTQKPQVLDSSSSSSSSSSSERNDNEPLDASSSSSSATTDQQTHTRDMSRSITPSSAAPLPSPHCTTRSRRVSTSAINPIASQLSNLHAQISQTIQGPLLEFQSQYAGVRALLESEHAELSSVILSLQAKRTYVLENQSFMRRTADRLKEFEQLQAFANPPELAELEEYQTRVESLENNGRQISEKALRLAEKMRDLAYAYNSTMNLVSGLFMEWDLRLTA